MKKNESNYNINQILKLKIVGLIVLFILILGGMVNIIYSNVLKVDSLSEDYKDKLIRFHVLANSDSKEDQELKLKVRDKVIAYLQPRLIDSENIATSEKIILKEKENIEDICKDVIKENGYSYNVSANLEYSRFPAKQYSSVVLPAGEYKALRIVIGDGNGKNWWCVMFPPLCFIDEQNNVIDEETDKKLKEVLTDQEYKLIVEKDNNKLNTLKIKFKIVEIFQKIIK